MSAPPTNGPGLDAESIRKLREAMTAALDLDKRITAHNDTESMKRRGVATYWAWERLADTICLRLSDVLHDWPEAVEAKETVNAE